MTTRLSRHGEAAIRDTCADGFMCAIFIHMVTKIIPVAESIIAGDIDRTGDFARDGFVVVQKVLAPDEVLGLRSFLTRALRQFEVTGDAGIGLHTETTECEAIWHDF